MLLDSVEGKKDKHFDQESLIRAASRLESLSPIKSHIYKFTDPNLLKVMAVIQESKQKKSDAIQQPLQDETILKKYLGKLIASALRKQNAICLPSPFYKPEKVDVDSQS
jgi:hypothetical protein